MKAFNLNLKDNAVFLSCWYERSRPVQMICFGILTLSVLLLSILSVFLNKVNPVDIWKSLFYIFAGIQALILLLQGTMFAGHMGARERTSETLDFHRNSPQPVFEKIFGLLLGSTWFEWALFALFFVLELPCGLMGRISLGNILLFNLSLMLTGVFLQISAATIALVSTPKKRGNSLLSFIFIMVFVAPAFLNLISGASPFASHIFGATAIKYIYSEGNFASHINGFFYTLELPLIVLQALAQIPLIVLMGNGMKRVFQLPNSPAWSKTDVISFFGFLFFMICGFFVQSFTHFDTNLAPGGYYRHYKPDIHFFLTQEVSFFAFLYVAIGIFASFFLVPSYFKCSKLFVLSKRGKSPVNPLFDDGATSMPAILIYVVLGGFFINPYFMALDVPVFKRIICFLLLSSYVIAFAGFLEFFRLGRFRNNKIFLVTAILVWFAFIPWMFALLSNFRLDRYTIGSAISPFSGVGYALSIIRDQGIIDPKVFIIPFMLAILMWLLAEKEHRLVEKKSIHS